jgi:hypothetical protein
MGKEIFLLDLPFTALYKSQHSYNGILKAEPRSFPHCISVGFSCLRYPFFLNISNHLEIFQEAFHTVLILMGESMLERTERALPTNYRGGERCLHWQVAFVANP